MPDHRTLPRYGFFARTVTLKRFNPDGELNLSLTVECMMVLINQKGMTIAIQPPAAAQDNDVAPFVKGDKIEVSLNPLLIQRNEFNVTQWNLQDVEVKWVESIKNDNGILRGFLVGMGFNEENLSHSVKEWINYIAVMDSIPPTGEGDGPQPIVPGENFCIGLNALGVACGIAALLFFRQPVGLRNALLWIMIATTVLYGSYKLFGGPVVRLVTRWWQRIRRAKS